MINRDLPKVKVQDQPFEAEWVEKKYQRLEAHGISPEDFKYFVFSGTISNQTYVPQDKKILIKTKKGKLRELQEVDPFFYAEELSSVQQKYFLCFPRNRHLT